MVRRPPRPTLTDTRFPYTTRFRSGFDGANSFSDVAVDSPHMDAINRLARVGIVTGGPGGLPADRYGPNDQVTRAQLASMLVRAENFLLAGDASTAAYP